MNSLPKNSPDQLFCAILELLKEQSWSESLIKEAEKIALLPKGYSLLIGITDITSAAMHLEQWLDKQMLSKLTNANILQSEKIRTKISRALEIRLLQVTNKDALLKTQALLSSPCNIVLGQKSAYNTCSVIWNYAGDQSTDVNHYTKRWLLLTIYNATKCFYLSDESDNLQDTKNFITEALDQVIAIGALKTRIKNKITLPKITDIPIIRLFS
jgi:ubiquinone biosynthesis protein COQ9